MFFKLLQLREYFESISKVTQYHGCETCDLTTEANGFHLGSWYLAKLPKVVMMQS